MANELIETLTLTIDGMAEDTFRPFRVSGVDEISQLFRFEIDVVSDDPSLDDSQIFGRTATLEMGRQDQSTKIYGLITAFQQGIATERGQFVYKAILMPRMQRLAMSRQNQIHGTTRDVSVVDVIRGELTADGLKGPGSAVAGRLSGNDVEMRLSRSYPQRDYIVQYEESDLNFVCRMAESQGIFFFFDHSSGKDVVVFGDSRVAFTPADGQSTLLYRRTGGLVEFGEAVVRDFTRIARPLPAKVVLRDYNYRLPHISLTAEAPVDPNGHGVVVEYGDHFRTPEEGAQLAKIRAEEIKAQGVVFHGMSDCVALSAGDLFQLNEHFRDDFNTRYVITKITHTATMPVEGISDLDGGSAEASYSNAFECIPNAVEYRPQRRTPKPVMAGLSNATVDAEGSGNRAEIDAQGRYKVRQSFDLREEADGKASLYVRKAEPYGGADSGMHLPLLKNTEVILACVNGDPNRPIIVGAVPNARNRSVITQKEQTSNRIRTTSGIVLQMDDGAGSGSSGGGSGAGAGAALAPQSILEGPAAPTDTQDLAAPRSRDSATGSDDTRLFMNVTGGSDSDYTDDNYLRFGAQRDSGESSYVADFTSVADGFLLYTPSDWNSLIKGGSFTRVNSEMRTAAEKIDLVGENAFGIATKALAIDVSSGTADVEAAPAYGVGDGKFSITTASDMDETIGGDLNQTISGSFNQSILGDASNSTSGSAWDVTTGDSQEVFMGNQVSVTLGASEEFTLSLAIGVAVGMTVDLALAIVVDLSVAMRITYEGSINLLVNDGGKVGLKLSYSAEYNVLGATAAEVEAEATSVEASSKSVEASTSSVTAKVPSVEAKVQSVSVEVPSIKATI